jgi:hypothetical protein
MLHDSYSHLILVYNSNYNLYIIPNEDTLNRYNPYTFKELLFND